MSVRCTNVIIIEVESINVLNFYEQNLNRIVVTSKPSPSQKILLHVVLD